MTTDLLRYLLGFVWGFAVGVWFMILVVWA